MKTRYILLTLQKTDQTLAHVKSRLPKIDGLIVVADYTWLIPQNEKALSFLAECIHWANQEKITYKAWFLSEESCANESPRP